MCSSRSDVRTRSTEHCERIHRNSSTDDLHGDPPTETVTSIRQSHSRTKLDSINGHDQRSDTGRNRGGFPNNNHPIANLIERNAAITDLK